MYPSAKSQLSRKQCYCKESTPVFNGNTKVLTFCCGTEGSTPSEYFQLLVFWARGPIETHGVVSLASTLMSSELPSFSPGKDC